MPNRTHIFSPSMFVVCAFTFYVLERKAYVLASQLRTLRTNPNKKIIVIHFLYT